jgi:hypothetical protein
MAAGVCRYEVEKSRKFLINNIGILSLLLSRHFHRLAPAITARAAGEWAPAFEGVT